MNILLVEDDNNKAAKIADVIKKEFDDVNLIIAKSYHSGMQILTDLNFDLLLLDMSMPTYDMDIGDVFNRHRNYAGEDFLYEMQDLNIKVTSIIITQYDVIGEGKNQTDAKQLNKRYLEEFQNFYVGMVKYDSSVSRWREDLINKIKEVKIG